MFLVERVMQTDVFSDDAYMRKYMFKVAMMLLIVGALNGLFVGVLGFNPIEKIFGKNMFTSAIYILIGISAVGVMFNRDTYLPFLGETVIPCESLPDRVPPGATRRVDVIAPPGAKILYWATEPSTEGMKEIRDWRTAYNRFENAGIATADETGTATLKVREPQPYTVPFKGRLEPHIHFRICGGHGMLGRVKTVFLKDKRVEGFSL